MRSQLFWISLLMLCAACNDAAPAITPTPLAAAPTAATVTVTAAPVLPTLEPTTASSPTPPASPTPRRDCAQRYATRPEQRPYWPTGEWRTGNLEEHCLDPEQIAKAAWYLKTSHVSSGLLIVRHGELVYEDYFWGTIFPETRLHVFSVTKSFLSALYGIAMQRGQLDSLDHRVVEYFPEYFHQQTDARMRQVTLRHLLTMSAGHFLSEDGTDEWMASENWVEAAINQSFDDQPGNGFVYNNADTHLAAAILTKIVGEPLRTYAQRTLFTPLGVTAKRWSWSVDPQGYAWGMSGMYLHPRDMARFGYLYLNQGDWDGQPILSREWVRESTGVQIDAGMGRKYGYLWWVQTGPEDQAGFAAHGSSGQDIYVFPRLDMVVVVSGEVAPHGAPSEFNSGSIVYGWILPAVTDAP